VILVDSSVWIDYFNGFDNNHTDYLDKVLDDGWAAIGDLIYVEILQGFRHDRDYRLARKYLRYLDCHTLLTPQNRDKSADHYRHLRKNGVTVRKTIDVIIATFCIENDIPLLFRDRDFLPFVKYSGLQSAVKH